MPLDVVDYRGWQPMHYACMKGLRLACCCIQCFREFKWEPKVMADAPKVALRKASVGAPESEEMSR